MCVGVRERGREREKECIRESECVLDRLSARIRELSAQLHNGKYVDLKIF